jgi:predicted nuclease of predicted toxin-antitoxin system
MIFWLDAQLPPGLAGYIADSFGVECHAVRDLGLRDAGDEVIFSAARQPGVVVITKDSDFLDLSLRHGPPPQILWLTCGNCGNVKLREILSGTFHEALALLTTGEAIVEISGR